VILGIALFNLPFGLLADRVAIRPILLAGGLCLTLGGLVCAASHDLWTLIGARFFQGVFIPTQTTCLAAYLARTLPDARLNVAMGAYVSATVLGGLGGRLLGGWIHPPLDWRYAFVSASLLTLAVTVAAFWLLPHTAVDRRPSPAAGVFKILKARRMIRMYLCGAGSFAVFSSVFNYLPFRLAGAPFHLTTQLTTMLYLVYILGIFIGPVAGRIGTRFGSGRTLLGGALAIGAALSLLLVPAISAVIVGLLMLCGGFFTVHAAAVGALNRCITGGQGRANALYVLFYYIGGWLGITVSGLIYEVGGWRAVIGVCAMMATIPGIAGMLEAKD
jgi:YNFM family putative membrane transporter